MKASKRGGAADSLRTLLHIYPCNDAILDMDTTSGSAKMPTIRAMISPNLEFKLGADGRMYSCISFATMSTA